MKMTISVDDVTRSRLDELRLMDGVSYSEAIRRGIWLLYRDRCFVGGDYDDCGTGEGCDPGLQASGL